MKPGTAKAPSGVEDPVVQATLPPLLTPNPTLTFEGISNEDNFNVLGFRVLPPDTNGDVGPNHYVQTVNLLFEIFSKNGTPVLGPLTLSSLFAGFGGPCETTDDGDPIALYDPLADRWLLSQFSVVGPPFHECVAISQTGDPTGSYFRYDFVMPNDKFNDYPKFGVWPDAYYMTDNQFTSIFVGGGVFAFDRARMLAGDPAASYIYFDLEPLDPTIGGMLPSDLDGVPPPDGTPNYFVYFVADEFGDPADGLRIFEFHPDFANPAASTFTERSESPLAVAAFNPNLCDFSSDCIPQPGTTQGLDALSDRLLYRLQYRNFGSHESLVVNHTVNNHPGGGNRAAVRYYELRRALPGGSFTVNEQATFAPDSRHRWMGSAAMDNDGNLAVAYSESSNAAPDAFPSLRYAARLATDPPNGLFQGEAEMFAGTGPQTSASGRWGDYSMLAVDPVNDCDFWFTSEFYTADNTCPGASTACFHTGIGSFTLASCTPPPAPGTLQGTVVNADTTAPIPGALVQTSGGFSRTTSGSGTYSISLPANTYSATASRFGYLPSTASGIVVTSGASTTQDFSLVPIPILVFSSAAVDDSGGNNNGVVDFDECAGLSIVLQNQGAADATGVSAALSTTTTGVTVLAASSAYPNIAAGGSAADTVPFRITTSPGFVPGTIIAFTLQVTTAAGPFTLTLQLATGTPDPTPATFSATGPVAIPDNDPAGATLPLTVSDITSAVSKVTVTLHITHTFDADLTLQLIGPDGTTVTLAAGVGGSGNNFGTDCPADGNDTTFDDAAGTSILSGSAPFVGSFRPTSALSVFKGKSGTDVNGTWALKVIDNFAVDTGNIECWSLSINGTLSSDGGGPCPGMLQGTVTNSVTNAVLSGVLVQASPGGFSQTTTGSGTYSMAVPPDTYDMTASLSGYQTGTASGVVVTSGGTTTQDFALVPISILGIDSSTVDDSAGNNNAIMDFNECAGLSITLENTGPADATGVSAALSTTTTGVTVISGSSTYPNITAGGSATNTVPFRIETSAGFVGGTPIDFTLQVTTASGNFTLTLQLSTGNVDGGGPCPSVQAPAALLVDAHSGTGTVSNLNGVFEPGESAAVEPAWQNQEVIPRAVTGAASSFGGPGTATYTLDDGQADYGTIAPAATSNCFDATGDCYRMTVSIPATRPSTHWDATFSEDLSTETSKVWTLHIGNSFTDVPTSHPFYRFVETIFHKGVTSGCSATGYCPDASTRREQMAIFLLRAKLGVGYAPPPAVGIFGDVPTTSAYAPWIEDLYNRGITSGCATSPLLYCPTSPVTREQMAVFLLRTLLGSSYAPPACTNPTFADVPCSSPFSTWVYDLAARGITVGCGGGNYCPTDANTRGQMAVFLTRTFTLRLYGP